jgi:hypothetical protein
MINELRTKVGVSCVYEALHVRGDGTNRECRIEISGDGVYGVVCASFPSVVLASRTRARLKARGGRAAGMVVTRAGERELTRDLVVESFSSELCLAYA